jgi:hypothetical protein
MATRDKKKMTKSANDSTVAETAPRQPLFYRKPEALTAERHGTLQLKSGGDFRFAKDANAVPITDVEFAAVSRWYPIVFTADPAMPLAVMGLQKENLFIGEDGQWNAERYVPAYVRRYPFVFIEHPGGFALGLDRDCDRVIEADGKDSAEPFFVDGKPSAFTKDAMNFSVQLQAQHRLTGAFGAALAEQGLLIDREANAVLTDGRRYNVQGFKIVDAQKFAALPGAVVLDWHKKGWLGLVQFHLASLDRFHDLMLRMPKEAA